ncbi:helix-turn-helix domain-containing protein [Rhizobium sp. BR 314]|uniref:AraC family transcriptional regulator n=1 Tax=Rhizobium sp. BR 314 TaxID=3040013 RepID=UPI0039BF13F4
MSGRLYPVGKSIIQVAKLLKISADRTVRRAGLPRDILQNEGKGLTPNQVFALWNAIEIEANRSDLPLYLSRLFAHAPFTPTMFSFSCSPDVRTGFQRLSVFKPLMGPMKLTISEDDTGLHIEIGSVDPAVPAPPQLVWFEALYLLESARCYTAEFITPAHAQLPVLTNLDKGVLDFLGCDPELGGGARLSLRTDDADLPLITENEESWPEFEKKLRRDMESLETDTPVVLRAKRVLHAMLPSGEASIEAMCRRLAMSKRTLQRQLKEEGETFQTVLAATRAELAKHYLREDGLNVEEISYLLAYREPNSFYRAFQSWTGMTPAEARRIVAH